MKKYVCTAGFALEQFDDDGFTTEKWMTVEEGDIWTEDDTAFRMVGGDDTVRLVRKKENSEGWMEITKETLATHFALVENT